MNMKFNKAEYKVKHYSKTVFVTQTKWDLVQGIMFGVRCQWDNLK